MLFGLARGSLFLQNLYIRLAAAVHPNIAHAMGKIEMLKKAFFHVTLDRLPGDYFEFGVYEGTSLLAAARIHRTLSAADTAALYGPPLPRRFYGYDAFAESGLRVEGAEAHEFFQEGYLSCSLAHCRKRLRRFPEVTLVKGYFEDTLRGRRGADVYPGSQCAILYIDCNLLSPARDALEFMHSLLQKGTVVILDDVFCYRGDPERGVQGAWAQFLRDHPQVRAREFFPYGCTGLSYIIYDL